jgi:hypothetical protein
MSIDLFGTFLILLIPLAGIVAAVYLLAVRRRRG